MNNVNLKKIKCIYTYLLFHQQVLHEDVSNKYNNIKVYL